MTITVNGTLLKDQLNDQKITVTQAEVILDGTINTLNIYLHTALSNLSGSAGTKSGSYTSQQTGAIFAVAVFVYRDFKNPTGATSNTTGLSVAYTPSLQVLRFAEKVACKLNIATEEPPIFVSNDPVPTS